MDASARRTERVEEGLTRTRETWFRRLARVLTEPDFDPALWGELEEALLGADVGLELTEELVARARERVQREGLWRGDQVREAVKAEMASLLGRDGAGSLSFPPAAQRQVLLVVGVNGSGKTTTIAKLARRELDAGRRVLLVAADTFRAAAIDQLRAWGERLGVEVVAHQPNADPGAVVYDGIQAARSRGVETVIVDTAGRLHTKTNLMEELRKIRRVIERAQPDASVRVLLVLDATTGQNGISQTREFTRAVPVDAIVLSKLDGTAKGGVALAIGRELGIPIALVGTGEGLEDLADFDPTAFVAALIG